jgi:hypothetical protein
MKLLVSLVLGVGTASLVACAGQAEIGEPCDSVGSSDECVDGARCDSLGDGTNLCLETCVEQSDCPSEYSCNGTSSSNVKTCHPDDSSK